MRSAGFGAHTVSRKNLGKRLFLLRPLTCFPSRLVDKQILDLQLLH